MPSNFMPEKAAIDLFLSTHSASGGITVLSGFTHALGEARLATGRDEHGKKVDSNLHGRWIGAIGYFALLDQISKCFKPKSAPLSGKVGILRALENFATKLNTAEREALYALRCAFAHDYSLYNFNGSTPSLVHNFLVLRRPSGPVVELPAVVWDGDYATRSATNQTEVNLEAFGDLVEEIVKDIYSLHGRGDLQIILSGGSDELLSRYTFKSG